jgi:hypothetical protein
MISMRKILSSQALALLLIFAHCGDDPQPPQQYVLEFASNASSGLEGSVITVSFKNPLPAGVTPQFTLGGTATENVDYTYTISPAGIVITTINDGNSDVGYDPDETIIIALTSVTGANAELGTSLVHTVTINETPLSVEFLAESSNRIEGQGLIVSFVPTLPAGVTPVYTISGTATQGTDYTVTQNSNGFVFSILKDEIYDPSETIIIELSGFSGNVVVGNKKKYTATLIDEDETQSARMLINLTWDAGTGGTGIEQAGDVDMDFLIFYQKSTNPETWELQFYGDAGTSLNPFENLELPSNIADGKYGISYIYYSGTSDNLNFTVNLRSYKGNINTTANRRTFTAKYTLANRNQWDVPDFAFTIEQTYEKSGNNYINMTEIAVPVSGSRQKSAVFIVDRETMNSMKLKAWRLKNR